MEIISGRWGLGEESTERDTKEISGVMEMFYIFTGVVIVQV